MLQTLIYETSSLENLMKMLDTTLRTTYDEAPGQYSQLHIKRNVPEFNDGRKWIIGPGITQQGSYVRIENGYWSKPCYMHICTIGDYKTGIKDGDETFDNFNELLRVVRGDIILRKDKEKFFEQCGDGYDDFFNEDDGSVGAGYRLAQRPMGGWNYLDIAFCHIYYGK